jgi:hypothetical protein
VIPGKDGGFARLWPILAAGVALIALVVLACAVALQSLFRPVPLPHLYRVDTDVPDGQSFTLRPLDPATLADRTEPTSLAVSGVSSWIFSDDGSTLFEEHRASAADQAPSDEQTFVIRDGHSGAERASFHPPAYSILPQLSRDGTRLVVEKGGLSGHPQPLEWFVFDASNGRVLATVRYRDEVRAYQTAIDPAARRLYLLVGPAPAPEAVGPWPVDLVAFDLATGVGTGRRPVPGVRAGRWSTGRRAVQETVQGFLIPALAVSPDGQRLAIVDGDADRVTLIDGADLAVVRTISFARPTPLLERLGLLPGVAEAKVAEGQEKSAHFAPDGRHLYVYGVRTWISASGRPDWGGLGLGAFDLDRGELVARAFGDDEVFWLQPAPDNGSLYALRPVSNDWVLDHLDATSLRVLAERTFSPFQYLLLAPTS